MDLTDWRGVQRPERRVLEGRYARLEPLDPDRHGEALFESARASGTEGRFRYLPDDPPEDRATFDVWLARVVASHDPLFFAVVDRATDRAEGRQTLMRIDPANGVLEVGNILWGPAIARTRVATEALFLFADYALDTLGNRRFEWKCNNANEPSKRAAERFGFTFEGVFRQHMVVKGENRDTAWYAMLDSEWPARRRAFERWLDPANFDPSGRQRLSLSALNAGRLDAGDPELRLRLAKADDLAALGELQRAAYAQNRAVLGVEPLPLLFDYDAALAHYEAWLVDGEDGPAGALILDPYPDHLLIWSLATAPAGQRQGLGTRLLAAAETRARQLGLDTLRLYTGEKLTGNVRWYHRHGYAIERVEELDDRRLVHMTKRI
jgi:RimJ/RimL family protein N-acetyltransferase/GNAT superfamily N-acetyltransferase